MIQFPNGGLLVEDKDDLPWHLVGCQDVYLDFETTSYDSKLDSLNPWHHCWIAGFGVTGDDHAPAYYIPVRDTQRDESKIFDFLFELFSNCRRWINHNVKYDAHVAANAAGVLVNCELVDTVTLAKIIDSDRMMKGGYGLDALCRDWLKEDISRYEAALAPYLHNNKDWGLVPNDIIGEYGCQDILSTRRLWKYIDAACPEESRGVWDTEIELTSVLFDMERTGMRIDPVFLKAEQFKIMATLLCIEEMLAAKTGRTFRPHVNEDCYDVLCNQYGLPVLGWTEEGNASFDKQAMAQYAAHPFAPHDVVKLISEYRKLNTFQNFFVVPYQELHVENYMHPQYNQCVRTGRLSCKKPNSQQLNKRAKTLVLPPPGHAFISIDYSQIEFRLIVHYIKNEACIRAYHENPDTDFHDLVAKLCGIHRKPAKNVNFCIGFGGGKGKVLSMLEANMELVGSLVDEVTKLVEAGRIQESQREAVFHVLARERAEMVYFKYHGMLPELKPTSREAARVCEARGFVRNLYGRRRYLPSDHAHKAFNNLNQSSAADLMKERTVAVSKLIKNTPIKIVASVHDETLFTAPIEVAQDPRVQHALLAHMESPAVSIRVPIRCAIGVSTNNWAEAAGSAKLVEYSRDAALTYSI